MILWFKGLNTLQFSQPSCSAGEHKYFIIPTTVEGIWQDLDLDWAVWVVPVLEVWL